jgi:polar amino acid transport system substrate-binding protein/glutamate/aspartate transport system substrate-binding protein
MLMIRTGAVLAALLMAGGAAAQTLERIQENGTIRLGYRTDAVPFAYTSDAGEPAGYSVELCLAVAASVEEQLGLDALEIEYVQVGAEDRFEAIQNGEIDLLCGATSVTLDRREIVDFSIPTFVDGASVLLPADGPASFEDLGGEKVGVRGGTTTEEALTNTLAETGVEAEVVVVSSHDEGLAMLESGEISAYFADQAILIFLGAQSETPLRLSDRAFTIEPYALALAHGDDDFRLAVDRALSRVYRSGGVERIFVETFGPKAKPSALVQALYVINALPE